MSKINLGDKAKDTITGLEGIVTSRIEYLNGCVRVGIQPQQLKDGKPVDSYFVDIEQVELVEASVAQPLKRTGGPMDDPLRPSVPDR